MNHPSVIYERPQFQLLYQDMGFIIPTLFIDQNLNDLKKRFTYAAQQAQYIVDLFLSGVHIRNNGHFPTSEDFKGSLNLDDVRRSFNSIKLELTSSMITNNMKLLDSSPRSERRTVNRSSASAAQVSFTRNPQRSKKVLDENIIVGIDCDAELIRDKLVEDQKKLDVVSIVGMGGIGKTTLANKVFNDGFVKYHFHVRVWLTVSQTYDKWDVLIQIMTSMGVKLDLEKASDSELRGAQKTNGSEIFDSR